MTDRDLLPPLDEAELRALLDRCLADVQAPDRLPASALAAGRRLRRRRRAGQITGGLLAAAACTAVIAVAAGGSHGTDDQGYAGNPTPTIAPSQRPTPSPSPTPSSDPGAQDLAPTGWWDMPSRRMVAVLEDLLPDGVTVTKAELRLEGTTEPTMAIGSLHGVITAATGPGAFQIVLYPPEPTRSRTRCEASMATCEPLLDASGAVIGRLATGENGGTAYYDVMLLGPDGGALYLYVADSAGEKPGQEAPTASEPPLTPELLVSLARDPAWTDYRPPA